MCAIVQFCGMGHSVVINKVVVLGSNRQYEHELAKIDKIGHLLEKVRTYVAFLWRL